MGQAPATFISQADAVMSRDHPGRDFEEIAVNRRPAVAAVRTLINSLTGSHSFLGNRVSIGAEGDHFKSGITEKRQSVAASLAGIAVGADQTPSYGWALHGIGGNSAAHASWNSFFFILRCVDFYCGGIGNCPMAAWHADRRQPGRAPRTVPPPV